ncbi:protein-L-isoaspartate(D-aspartate) O-methyltransferase [Castellaniella sp. FW104-16D08]|uniref:protein-L-isoaspartate(D-aspartate) O-methyltransferase n=1 Tax=unclassified Castellaniella TaxID=2617606 RepID=UPI0033156099
MTKSRSPSNPAAQTRRSPVRSATLGPGYSVANSNTRILGPTGPAGPVSARVLPGNKTVATSNLGLNSDRLRTQMVRRLREQGISDERILAAMQGVARHDFVDQGLASRAYEDAALPIGYGQTISQPWVVAYMLAVMSEGRNPQKVLEIGAGCGYQAAVLAQFVPEVYAVERIRGLYDQARLNLSHGRPRSRVRLSFGDGMQGLEHRAPFDGIVVAAAGVKIPEILLHQLAVGARLIAPEGAANQRLILFERTGAASWHRVELEDVRFVPLRPGTQT